MPIAMATEEQVDTDESGIEFQSLFQQLGHILSEDEVSEWLTSDLHDNGYLHISDDGIVSSVIEQHEESDEESDCEANLQDSAASTISHSTAVNAFDQCLSWLRQQEEVSVYNVGVLNELRELAARKRMSSLKQKTITDYFKSN